MTLQRVPPEEISKIFRHLWGGLRSDFFKLETLQSYQVPSEQEALELFASNRRQEAVELLQRSWDSNLLWDDALRRKIRLRRVHVVDLPLSPYLEFEIETYKLGTAKGECIGIVTTKQVEASNLKTGDFLLFDDAVVVIHHFDSKGVLLYSEIGEDPNDVLPFVHAKDWLLTACEPLELFLAHQADT